MSREVVAQLPDGTEYGFATAAIALKLHPDAKIVRYQDGEDYEASKPAAKKADPKDKES